jgi:predicted Fe-Mo cluster-binding NifX family protein
MDHRFGRAAGFFVIDTDSGETQFLDNSKNNDAEHGAGTSASQFLASEHINVLISGRIGPKAGKVLGKAGIKSMLGIEGSTIKRMFEDYYHDVLEEQHLD